MTARPRLLLLCGGQSDEHDVSLSSARSVVAAAGERFDVTPLVITRAGRLLPAAASRRALETPGTPADERASLAAPALEDTAGRTGALPDLQPDAYDVVFPLLHGPYGEDGTVQGLLRLMNLPFVGADVLGSAVGMDKLAMKAVFAAHGLPQVPYAAVPRSRWRAEPDAVLADLERLAYPLFVKPANLGSSVGISRAQDDRELRDALELAARFDRRIIVEEGVPGARELEVGVLGNEDARVTPVGEIRYTSDFYDYETKYTPGRADLDIPAAVPPEIAERCQALALEAFRAIDCAGIARVDFFYCPGPEIVLVNEINTMPGFTTTSMYPKLWDAAGVPYGELVADLVRLALERHGERATQPVP